MSDINTEQDLFKFVVVRSPEPATVEKPTKKIERVTPAQATLAYDRSSDLHPPIFRQFEPHFGDSDPVENANHVTEEAKRYLNSNDAIRSNSNDEVIHLLLRVNELTKNLITPRTGYPQQDLENLRDLVQSILGRTPSEFISTAAFKQSFDRLWSTYYALTIVDQYTHQYQQVLAAMRVANLLKLVGENELFTFKKVGELRMLMQASPLLPKELVQLKQALLKKPLETEEAPPAEDPDIKQRKMLAAQATKLRAARNELTRIEEAYREELETKQQTEPEPEQHPPEGSVKPQYNGLWQRLVRVFQMFLRWLGLLPTPQVSIVPYSGRINLPTQDPWILPDQHIDQLSEASKQVFQEVGIQVKNRRIPRVFEQIDAHLATINRTLVSASVVVPVRKIGTGFKAISSDRTKSGLVVALGRLPHPDFEVNISTKINILGIGDLLIVRQKLLRYVAGEVAHIENVLSGEMKKRTHHRLNRTEEIIVTETEREEEQERDLQSTDRFELQRESEKAIQTQMSLTAGTDFSAQYGPVKVGASVQGSLSLSKSESERAATSYAQEVTEKAVSQIREKVHEQQTRKLLEEIEETNVHGFEAKDEHVTGVYRWVDKIYSAQIFNYGRRLMLEFIVPEPAAFYRYLHETQAVEGSEQLFKPLAPCKLKQNKDTGEYSWDRDENGNCITPLSPDDIQPDNYQIYVTQYQVEDVETPPVYSMIVSTALEGKSTSETEGAPAENPRVYANNTDITIPDGYYAQHAFITGKFDFSSPYFTLDITVGREHIISWAEEKPTKWTPSSEQEREKEYFFRKYITSRSDSKCLHCENGALPVAIFGQNINAYAFTLEINCIRTAAKLQEWQNKTYNSIMSAYAAQLSDYEEKLSTLEIQAGIQISGQNPQRNREIEREELKKHCIALMFEDNNNFNLYDHLSSIGFVEIEGMVPNSFYKFPQINKNVTSLREGYVRFFEHAFEWDQMTYIFYPYFWASENKWLDIASDDDTDPQFGSFLRAGSARVILPVRPAFETAVYFFLATGKSRLFVDAPGIDDDFYLSITEELIEPEGNPVGEPWEVVVPTSLVYLQTDSKLPDFTEETSNTS